MTNTWQSADDGERAKLAELLIHSLDDASYEVEIALEKIQHRMHASKVRSGYVNVAVFLVIAIVGLLETLQLNSLIHQKYGWVSPLLIFTAAIIDRSRPLFLNFPNANNATEEINRIEVRFDGLRYSVDELREIDEFNDHQYGYGRDLLLQIFSLRANVFSLSSSEAKSDADAIQKGSRKGS